MKASDLFVQCLEAEGIEYIFGVPGEENADFVMSLEKSSTIKFVLTRHEQGAAFMAEVYGRLTGNPACCIGTLGPGATNLITGLADSNMDRAPMLVLTGQGATTRLHKESHQIMDAVQMFEPVTKWATGVYHPDTIPEIIRKAVRLARTEKPGAVHIELPEDVAKMETAATPLQTRRFRRSVADDKIVDRAFDLLTSAKRPVIVAGNGCIRRRASKQLRLLCEKTGIGVISTFMAKGAVDMEADYCLYTVGLGRKDRINFAIDDADLVLTLGLDMVEYHPQLWNPEGDKLIIHADFLPAEIDSHYHPEVELVGDLAHTLWMLNERLQASGVLAISGDGGFLMNAQEMETAKRLNSNLVVMVWEDCAYGLIAWKQEDQFGRHTDLAFTNPHWMQLAAAFGWRGHRVAQSYELKNVLDAALQERGPSLLVIPVDYRENPLLTRKLGELTCTI